MEGQMMQLFRGLFAINLNKATEVNYWAERFGVTTEQLLEAAGQAASQSVNGLRLALANLGYLRLDQPED